MIAERQCCLIQPDLDYIVRTYTPTAKDVRRVIDVTSPLQTRTVLNKVLSLTFNSPLISDRGFMDHTNGQVQLEFPNALICLNVKNSVDAHLQDGDLST